MEFQWLIPPSQTDGVEERWEPVSERKGRTEGTRLREAHVTWSWYTSGQTQIDHVLSNALSSRVVRLLCGVSIYIYKVAGAFVQHNHRFLFAAITYTLYNLVYI